MSGPLATVAGLAWGGALRGSALQRLRMRKLRAMVRHAMERVPAYREIYGAAGVVPGDLRRPADLARLPILRRGGVDPERLLAEGTDPARCLKRRTGGSTGHPLSLLTLREDFTEETLGWIRTWHGLGMRWTDTHAALKEPDDTFHEGRTRWFQRLGLLNVHHFDLYRDPAELAREIVTLAPDVLRGPPSALDAVAASLDGATLRPRRVFTTSERLDPAVRARLHERFGVEPGDCYGATEAGCIGWRCPSCGDFHVNADRVIVEIVDEEGNPVPPGGSGEVIVTGLFARAMPVLRYALGDRARLAGTGCPRGRGAESIGALEGRTVEQIVLTNGRIVSPYEFMPDELAGIRASAAVQIDATEVRILVVPGEGFREEELAAFCREAERLFDGAIRVSRELLPELPGTPAERLRRVRRAPLPDAGSS
jgi:phenylacetate-coenzyme A ligase PaaK-like adenylate-forming protein